MKRLSIDFNWIWRNVCEKYPMVDGCKCNVYQMCWLCWWFFRRSIWNTYDFRSATTFAIVKSSCIFICAIYNATFSLYASEEQRYKKRQLMFTLCCSTGETSATRKKKHQLTNNNNSIKQNTYSSWIIEIDVQRNITTTIIVITTTGNNSSSSKKT